MQQAVEVAQVRNDEMAAATKTAEYRCPSRFAGGLPLGCVEVLGTFRLAQGRRSVVKRELLAILRHGLAEWMCRSGR